MKEDGITPKETRYQTEKQFLRDAIDDAASTARSPEEFSKILDDPVIAEAAGQGRKGHLRQGHGGHEIPQ